MIQKGSFLEPLNQPSTLCRTASVVAGKKSRPAMKIGYARVSTEDQNLNLQIDALKHQGCARVYKEKITGTIRDRPALNKALAALQPGDVLVVWKLDRLGRSLQDLIEILRAVDEKGVGFQSLADGIDTTTPYGRLLFHIIGAVAEFECSQISQRTTAGLRAASRRGVRLGRPRCVSDQQVERARLLSDVENLPLSDIAARLKLNRTTLKRAMTAV